jgi:nucleotide-binding universal stress UspA family protein
MSKHTVMVALSDAKHIESLMDLACEMAKSGDAELVVVHVVEMGNGWALDVNPELLDQAGKAILSYASRTAAKNFSEQISTELVRAHHPGEAIVQKAKEHHADLLILGYRHRYGWGEIILGSTIQYVADNAPCRIVVQIVPLNGHRG